MTLASLKSGRYGKLVVSRELAQAVAAPKIAPTMQTALHNWKTVTPQMIAHAAHQEQQ